MLTVDSRQAELLIKTLRGTGQSWLKMVGRQLIVVVFFLECISLVVVSAFPLSTTRKIESQPREEFYARAAVERRRRWIDSERPFSPTHRMLRPPPPVLEQEITTKQPFDIEADPRTKSLTDNGLSKLTPAQLVRLYLLLLTNWKLNFIYTGILKIIVQCHALVELCENQNPVLCMYIMGRTFKDFLCCLCILIGGLKLFTESDSSTVRTLSLWLSQAHTCLPIQGPSEQHMGFLSIWDYTVW